MFQKKNFVINCDVCDARRVQEEDLSGYEQININTNILMVDERSKAILNRLPTVITANETLETEDEDIRVVTANGRYELAGDTQVKEKTLLSVNGSLVIHSGTEKQLESLMRICVNGNVRYPESLASLVLSRMSVNGGTQCIPDGCTELGAVVTPDRYFSIRAREKAIYYVDRKVFLTDPEVDLPALVEKGIRFLTKRFVVPQERVEQALPLFDEKVEMTVVPTGLSCVCGDACLDEALLRKYGNRLYIDGNLHLDKNSRECLEMLERIQIRGEVKLPKNLVDAFDRVDAVYGSMRIMKGRVIGDKAHMVVDQALLDASPDGVEVGDCAFLTIKKDVTPEAILDRLSVGNCAHVSCSPEQRSALELVCENVADISSGEEEGAGGILGGILNVAKLVTENKIVNAEKYIL